ncbi:F-box only protein 39 [Spea bombifrons]|uniref:F-box only protein 39 n=1 Tax=Spea bombifrons TaxID=233779 RepID=UPI00234BDBE0|nr:F-box only protein 39 [Spea bombifrons]
MDQDSESCWVSLPDVCLEKVFMYLGDRNRFNAALVCKKWNKIMYSAVLWKSRTIIFRGRSSLSHTTEYQSAIWYIKKFGRLLEHLEIRFLNSYSFFLTRKFQIAMKTILLRLSRTNKCLKSLSIPHLELERMVWKSKVKNAFVHSLSHFLRKKGRHLESFNVRGARMTLEHGCSILKSLSSTRNVAYASVLSIEDLFSHHISAYNSDFFQQTMSAFQNLKTLSLNYNCVSDKLLDMLHENCSHSLTSLNIKCHIYDPHMHVVKGISWKKLAKEAKDLKVNFFFERVLLFSRLSAILLPEIPMGSISLTSCYFHDPDWFVKPTLTDLLPNYRNTLQMLTLEYNDIHESLDEVLIELVLECKKLHYLKVWAFLDVSFVEIILQKQMEGKCCLTTFKVRVYTQRYDTAEEDGALHAIFLKYMDIIIPRINYFVIAYPMV